jgi:transcription initiation factor TFIIIB Brf1 subunit/transcription initiation factor TFIIB
VCPRCGARSVIRSQASVACLPCGYVLEELAPDAGDPGASGRKPDRATMSRERKVAHLLERLDGDSRRLDLDRIDARARSTNSWGSGEHRQARDKREQQYEATRATYEKLSDEQLDQALDSVDGSA